VSQCRQAGVNVWVKQYRKNGKICGNKNIAETQEGEKLWTFMND